MYRDDVETSSHSPGYAGVAATGWKVFIVSQGSLGSGFEGRSSR